MLITGEANNASIELSEPEGLKLSGGSEFYRVTLREDDFEVSLRVYAFNPTDNSLSNFLFGLAADWKGWGGIRHWSSLEGEFELACEHDGLGHVTTAATLRSNPYRHGWLGQIRFDIAAVNLGRIASDVGSFLNTTA